ncbi:hypothetical protein M501DRAFT_980600 [Patellaria atrata CBS 101060]|uniref:HAUS augmin-like complex subunit 3 N-terminal domain-containing protein n=1 Tax=Patellaria atrata CBS 101060 TaxID=1346257 RepID=A0A9P4S671_9PEZI|nr:hypothetical protein M501DRAFT_980600 [Patellaria atrata CBS 101060]
MSNSSSLEHLVKVLEERVTGLERDDVQWAFESVKTKDDATAWVDEYLNDDTLLSKEELDLFQKIQRKGPKFKPLDEQQTTRPFLNEDLEAAIAALESSTSGIENHSRSLEVQKKALSALIAQNKPDRKVVQESTERRRKYAQESGHLRIAVDELSQSVDEQLTATQRDSSSTISSFTAVAMETLTSDDRLLNGISSLIPKLQQNIADEVVEKAIEQWCQAVTAFRAAEIRSRIDKVYEEALIKPNFDIPTSNNALQTEEEALQGELDTLYAEIKPVLEMVVHDRFRSPILRDLQSSGLEQRKLQNEWLSYITSTLTYMTKRLALISTQFNLVHELQSALIEVQRAYIPLKAQSTRISVKDTSTTPHPDPLESIEQIRAYLAMSNPPKSADSPLMDLAKQTVQKRSQFHGHLSSAELNTIQELSAALSHTDDERRRINNALYASTSFGTVSLENSDLSRRIRELEDMVGSVSLTMGNLDTSAAGDGNGKERREFVRKWA